MPYVEEWGEFKVRIPKKVKFRLLSDKLTKLLDPLGIGDIEFIGEFYDDGSKPTQFKYSYQVIRVDKEVDNLEAHYSFLKSTNEPDEITDVTVGLTGALSAPGDTISHDKPGVLVRYSLSGILYTDADIISGSVLKYMVPLMENGNERKDELCYRTPIYHISCMM